MSTTTSTAPVARRRPGLPARLRRGSVTGVVVLLVALVLASLPSLAVGSRNIPLATVVDVLVRPDSSDASSIVHGLRVPRSALSLLVGLALGIAGAMMQGHTRNALADPGLLGVSSGAGTTPSSSRTSCSVRPMLTTRVGCCCSIVVVPNWCSTTAGKVPDDGPDEGGTDHGGRLS